MIWTTSTTSTSSTEKICQERAMWEGQSLTFFLPVHEEFRCLTSRRLLFSAGRYFFLIFVDSARFGFHGRLSEPWFSLDTEKRNSIKYVAYFVFFVAIWFWQDSEYDHHWDDQIDLLFGARKRLWWWTFQLLATRSMNRNCLDKWSFFQILDSR